MRPARLGPRLRGVGHQAQSLDDDETVLYQHADAHAETGEREQVGGDLEQVEAERGPRDRDRRASHHQHHTA
jgi:hypothetical protein